LFEETPIFFETVTLPKTPKYWRGSNGKFTEKEKNKLKKKEGKGI